jgi:hypothetical protein
MRANVSTFSKIFEVTVRWCRHNNSIPPCSAALRHGYQLEVGSPGTQAISLAMFPQQSVVAQLMPGWPKAVTGAALRPSACFAARSFATRGFTILPECCIPITPLADVPAAEQADRLRDMTPDVLAHELHAIDADQALSPGWLAAAEQPRRWPTSMADASLDTWAALKPRWQAAMSLFDREARRVRTAAVRGGMGALLNSLHPQISYADGVLAVAFPYDRCVALVRRRLALVPPAA